MQERAGALSGNAVADTPEDPALRRQLLAVLDRHPSPGPMLRRIRNEIDQLADDELTASLRGIWRAVIEDPVAFAAFFPASLRDGRVGLLLRSLRQPILSEALPGVAALQGKWRTQESDVVDRRSSLRTLLADLERGPTDDTDPRVFHARLFGLVDRLYVGLVEPGLAGLQARVVEALHRQRVGWSQGYCGDYAYQGLESVGIQGWKPSERRLRAYRVDDLLTPETRIFDIGANCGLLAVEMARRVGHVEGLDINPFLLDIGRAAAEHLGLTNVTLRAGDFAVDRDDRRWSVVLSLSNHQTTDQRLALRFEEHVVRCWSLLEPGGHLLFESHNVFGPGRGGPGDDGDIEQKFEVLERWFELERHHMVRPFVPQADVSKLFAVLRRRDRPDPTARRTLELATAKERFLDD